MAAKISLASRLALIDPTVAKALHALRGVRNDFAHSADETSLAASYHRKRLGPAYEEARANPLWPRLEAILEAQGGLDADQRQFILLVTVLVAFIESCARLQHPFQPRARVQFSGGSIALSGLHDQIVRAVDGLDAQPGAPRSVKVPGKSAKLETPKREVVENRGLEPLTSAVRSQRSTS